MQSFKSHFFKETMCYDGRQLAPLWIYKNCHLRGNAIVSFIGPADVTLDRMVDIEDVKAQKPIYSELMVHFLAEFFDLDLEKTVYRQRLLITHIQSALEEKLSRPPARISHQKSTAAAVSGEKCGLRRRGDDLYDGDAKLTVSIATLSGVSTLIHAGMNISSRNTPVPTRGLEDYDISPEGFAKTVLDRFQEEMRSSWLARCKVRPV